MKKRFFRIFHNSVDGILADAGFLLCSRPSCIKHFFSFRKKYQMHLSACAMHWREKMKMIYRNCWSDESGREEKINLRKNWQCTLLNNRFFRYSCLIPNDFDIFQKSEEQSNEKMANN